MRKKRVLIVDGEEASRIALKRSFETREPDYQVVIAPDGFKALGRLVQQRVDLVLLSCHLIGMDRLELAEAIRDIAPQTRILLMLDGDTCLLGGAVKPVKLDGWIGKTCPPAQIWAEVERIIGSNKPERAKAIR